MSMCHPNTERLIDYWQSRALDGAPPPRTSISPADFADLLPQVVMLGRVCSGIYPIRLAGALIALAAVLFRGFPRIGERLVRLQAPGFAFFGRRLSLPMIVLISVGAGVGEEALFRGGLQTLIGDHLGVAAAILLSSAAFAAIHLARPVITALLLVIGAIFGVFYWQTGSLLAAMIGHALYDIWALRYLHREMHRLGLFDAPGPPPGPEPAPLVNSPGPG